MPLTNVGRDHIAKALIAESAVPFDASNAYVGVGNSTTAFTATQTDLIGASQLRRGMSPTYPQRATNVLTYQATFVEAEANFAWQEVAVFNAAAAGTMLARKVASLGTKTSADQWKCTMTVTVTAA